MIEITPINNAPSKHYLVRLHNQLLDKNQYNSFDIGDPNEVCIFFYDANPTSAVAKNCLLDIPANIKSLALTIEYDWIDLRHLNIRRNNQKVYEFQYELYFDIEGWKKPWSIEEYCSEFSQVFEAYDESGITLKYDDDIYSNQFMLCFETSDLKKSFRGFIDEQTTILKKIQTDTIQRLILKAEPYSLSAFFDFPDEHRTVCEQYLFYFTQFLSDLHIKTTTRIQPYGEQTLLQIVPKDKETALSKIRDLLNFYLSLPMIPDAEIVATVNVPPQFHQLVANVQHLKSQLMLKNAVIEAQQATIAAQSATIEHQNSVHLNRFMVDSLRAITDTARTTESEKVLRGAVTIKKYEGNGYEIDLPMIMRTIKDLFSKRSWI